jgi:DMSO/TMAO reductase YedYZ molybdopterin-dependent catalytic subunit
MDRIISPDTKREHRLPPGQKATDRWPVLHYGNVRYQEAADWTLTINGLVAQEVVVTWEQFQALPPVEVFSDIHCVTRWSRYDNTWNGVSSGAVRGLAAIKPEATHVTVHGAGGFTTNLSLADFFQPDVLFATHHDGKPISAEHGGPVRLVVPQLYFWKSAKWVTGLTFRGRKSDTPGTRERRHTSMKDRSKPPGAAPPFPPGGKA